MFAEMPSLMSVSEFATETRDDFNSPTTSSFVSRMPHCRQTVASLEESLDFDRDGLTKMKKAVKAIYNGGNAHYDNEVYLSKALERLGANAMTKDQEPDIGAAFIKFSIVTKELSALMKTLMQNMNNIIMFPLDNILKGELKGVKGDIKKPFDKAWKEYETKITKIEKEKRQQAKEAGLIRTEISSAEIAEEMDRERKIFQLQMCEYLIKVNEIKTKKGAELLQHLVEYYNAQTNYFHDGLKTIEHFNGYINELSVKLQRIRLKQEDERKNLIELRALLKSSSPFLDSKDVSVNNNNKDNVIGYSLHQMQGNKSYGYSKAGHLFKKSEGKMRVKVWQKRKCEVNDGFLYIFHSDESKSPTKVNLLTCQIKTVPDDKKSFDVISYNRTYHFQTEDETETQVWTSVLINCKEGALKKEFDNNCVQSAATEDQNYSINNQSLRELQQSIISYVQKLPGNDRCVDCNSTKDPTWLSTNFGVLTCIECSGIHREMGVHVSRIQSLTLDNIGTSQLLLARIMSNSGFNDIMEGTLNPSKKPLPTSSMEIRNEFIRAKYIDHKFAIKTCSDSDDLKADLEHAVLSRHLLQLLQAFAEGADLTWTLPDSCNDETSLHYAVAQEDGTTLHIVDFLAQNSSHLNSVTKEGNTSLHYCVLYNQSECMKLLLRSGMNFNIKNNEGKTALDLAKERKNFQLIDLLENASQNKKSLFDNVNIDWRIFPDDPSTDFSDEDLNDDKRGVDNNWSIFGSTSTMRRLVNGAQMLRQIHKYPLSSLGNNANYFSFDHLYLPHSNQLKQSQADRLQRSRPSSVVGSESPSSKSSDSSKQQNRKITSFQVSSQQRGSIKKRSAPSAPQKDDDSSGSNCSSVNHNRTASESGTAYMPQTQHWRNNSIDLGTNSNVENTPITNRLVVNSKTNAQPLTVYVSDNKIPQMYGMVQRPKQPPPPTPDRLINGQSNESLPSLSSEAEEPTNRNTHLVPIPPPRKVFQRHEGGYKHRRCLALYDCDADREDELAFREGEILVVTNDVTEDDEWMEGMVESEPQRRGVFPISFVHFLRD